MDHRKISAKGGRTTKKRYGSANFRRIGTIGGNTLLSRRGSEYFRELSRKGVEARKKKAARKKPILTRVIETIASV